MRFVIHGNLSMIMALYAKMMEVADHDTTTVEDQNYVQMTMANNRPALMFRSFDSTRYAWVFWGQNGEGFVLVYATQDQLDKTVGYPSPGLQTTHKEILTSMDDVLNHMSQYVTRGKLPKVPEKETS